MIKNVYDGKNYRQLALESKEKAFSIVHSVKQGVKEINDQMQDQAKGEIELVHTEQRFEPFWHVQAESFIEYKRNTPYKFKDKPKARSVKINNKAAPIEGEEPIYHFVAEHQHIEQYKKEITVDAMDSKDKKITLISRVSNKK